MKYNLKFIFFLSLVSCKYHSVACLRLYVFTQHLHHEQSVAQGQFLSRTKLVWIQNFLFSLVALPRLKSSDYPIIYL